MSDKRGLPVVGLTMGEPTGVGPELCLRALAAPAETLGCQPVVFGDASVLDRVAACVGLPPALRRIGWADWMSSETIPTEPTVVDLAQVSAAEIEPGCFGPLTGRASYAYIQAAMDAAAAGRLDAITTGPIQKEALHQAGIRMPGHTEMFAARFQAPRWCMMQYSDAITCTFVTVHVGYAEVPGLLTTQRILDVIELTAEALQRIRRRSPSLVVCGLNPHAGEHGLFGQREEERLIQPAIDAARRAGLRVEGPLPPDTAFVPAKRATTDAFICMYHDQGHIPVKALAFDSAVNTTLGLPVIRTSVDHGTALDIAWKGLANPGSLFSALRLASQLSRDGETP